MAMDPDSTNNNVQKAKLAETVTVRHGSCICKRVCYTLSGEPVGFRVCHCTHCKKASGSAFLSNVFFKEEQIHLVRVEDDALTVFHDTGTSSGHTLERLFCKHCGSTMFLRSLIPLAVEKKLRAVALGTLDDVVDWVPEKEVFPHCRSSYVKGIELAPRKSKL